MEMFKEILTPTIVLAAMGLILGLVLGIAAKLFAVKIDEKTVAIRELLPGANCGGCGFAGCDQLAKSIVEGTAPCNGCPVTPLEKVEQIAEIMGTKAGKSEKMAAVVKCNGTCDVVGQKYEYHGIMSCEKAVIVPGAGAKNCQYGCLGYGSCVTVCKFGAISIVNGVAVVDTDKCTACGQCVKICPKKVIELIPAKATVVVKCNSNDAPKATKDTCKNGCMGCKVCVKQCPNEAITVENNLARINQTKCTGCGACAEKCMTKAINVKLIGNNK